KTAAFTRRYSVQQSFSRQRAAWGGVHYGFQNPKHKRNKLVRVSIGAPWKRRSMLAMSQLGHYVNRRNVQAAVSQVWPIFFGGRLGTVCTVGFLVITTP